MKTILIDLYIKVNVSEQVLPEARLNKIEETILLRTYKVGEDFFHQPVEIYVLCDKGSLSVWVAILGSIYAAIGNYGDFRSGLKQIIEDINAYVKYVKTEILGQVEATETDISQLQDDGMIRALANIFQSIDYLEYNKGTLSIKERDACVQNIRENILNTVRNMKLKDRKMFIQSLPGYLKDVLPKGLSVPNNTTKKYEDFATIKGNEIIYSNREVKRGKK